MHRCEQTKPHGFSRNISLKICQLRYALYRTSFNDRRIAFALFCPHALHSAGKGSTTGYSLCRWSNNSAIFDHLLGFGLQKVSELFRTFQIQPKITCVSTKRLEEPRKDSEKVRLKGECVQASPLPYPEQAITFCALQEKISTPYSRW